MSENKILDICLFKYFNERLINTTISSNTSLESTNRCEYIQMYSI